MRKEDEKEKMKEKKKKRATPPQPSPSPPPHLHPIHSEVQITIGEPMKLVGFSVLQRRGGEKGQRLATDVEDFQPVDNNFHVSGGHLGILHRRRSREDDAFHRHHRFQGNVAGGAAGLVLPHHLRGAVSVLDDEELGEALVLNPTANADDGTGVRQPQLAACVCSTRVEERVELRKIRGRRWGGRGRK